MARLRRIHKPSHGASHDTVLHCVDDGQCLTSTMILPGRHSVPEHSTPNSDSSDSDETGDEEEDLRGYGQKLRKVPSIS